MGCPPLCMILVHSGWKCVHQIDISVRCIGYKQKNLQIQFYCQPRASPVFSCGEQRCRINGLPDLVYYWASLKGGKKRAPDFDWWVPLSSQITAHPSPFSHVARFLFSHNQLPVASVRRGTWVNENRNFGWSILPWIKRSIHWKEEAVTGTAEYGEEGCGCISHNNMGPDRGQKRPKQ